MLLPHLLSFLHISKATNLCLITLRNLKDKGSTHSSAEPAHKSPHQEANTTTAVPTQPTDRPYLSYDNNHIFPLLVQHFIQVSCLYCCLLICSNPSFFCWVLSFHGVPLSLRLVCISSMERLVATQNTQDKQKWQPIHT